MTTVTRTVSAVASILILAAVLAGGVQAGTGNVPQGFSAQEWNALQLRSEALNQKYHLGAYRNAGDSAQAQRAILLRSDALNRKYRLGRYAIPATTRQSSGFDWGDAGIGSAATLGLLLTGIGLAGAARRFRNIHQSPVV
jgi:hypothetical protein